VMNQNVKVVCANTIRDALLEERNWTEVVENLKNLLKEKGVLTWNDLLDFTRKRFGNDSIGYWAMTLLNLLIMAGVAENDPDENGTIVIKFRRQER